MSNNVFYLSFKDKGQHPQFLWCLSFTLIQNLFFKPERSYGGWNISFRPIVPWCPTSLDFWQVLNLRYHPAKYHRTTTKHKSFFTHCYSYTFTYCKILWFVSASFPPIFASPRLSRRYGKVDTFSANMIVTPPSLSSEDTPLKKVRIKRYKEKDKPRPDTT